MSTAMVKNRVSEPPEGCPRCRERERELEKLRTALAKAVERITALEAEVRRGKRQAAPFARGTPKKDPKPPGRRPGEGAFRRRLPPAEEEILQSDDVPLSGCPGCGGEVEANQVQEHYQLDLPEVRPFWRRFRTYRGHCARCGIAVASRHPEQVSTAIGAAAVSLGPRAKALASDLKHRLGVPYRKIADLFRTAFDLEVSAGALQQADVRLAEKARPLYAELIEALRRTVYVHADETGWRVGALSAWLWVFTGEQITVYTIERRRSHEVILQILGEEFEGVLVSDCFVAYDHHRLRDWLHQKCFAHLLKDLSALAETDNATAVRFAQAVARVLRAALVLASQRETTPAELFRQRLREIEAELDRLLEEPLRSRHLEAQRMYKRLHRQRDRLFTFVLSPGLDATNNAAERMLRPEVVVRKTGGCNRTWEGAFAHAVLGSILVTLKQQGRDVLDYLEEVLTAPGAPPSLLATPPPQTA
jgi:transposase